MQIGLEEGKDDRQRSMRNVCVSKIYGKRAESRSYVFERCRDRLRFVLVLQVLVGNLKDALRLFPFLFILRHVTWGESANKWEGILRFYNVCPSSLAVTGLIAPGRRSSRETQMLRLIQVLNMF